ncbi:uncharacterized protein N7496_008103 [Penicillium cataractarum]|uniref:Uncharacterized protein n=1 Tax=Penicillium cataractarum TaxID=2100454 RepID=A0A9W9RXR8_9EURO|nr:uncharacterized protein N7496_008103 [Penicillium cataractarum]KAJ5368343.1 hypothetical protein N7496_008103 [Penicillium cataractarum]
MFLHCPPWRKPRPASPSDVARSNQATHACDLEAQWHRTRGPYPAPNHSPSPHSKYHPESISRIIRRRFSRESRASSAHHEPSKFMFPFPRKSSRSALKPATALATLGGYGSSLMSESRYDSDAQFISTPRRELIDSPAHRARRRMELSGLIERSQEQQDSERWAIGMGDDIPEPPESVYGMRFIQTPPSTLRSHRGPYQKVNHAVSLEGDQKHGMISAKSMFDLNSTSQRGNGSGTGPSHALDYIRGGNGQKHLTTSQSMGMSSHKHGMASSNPLSNQPPDLVVAKRRQRTDSGVFLMDNESVHLEDMRISYRLASQSASSAPMSCNPSIAELICNNRYGPFMNASQENMPIALRSTTSITSGNSPQVPAYHHQQASSYYSRQPSCLSANASPSSHSLAPDAEQQAGMVPGSRYNVSAEDLNPQNGSPLASGAIGSKFREHCDNEAPPDSHGHIASKEVHGTSAPRKVSVGWMSGGRRVGYGYNPVPDDEAARYQQHEDGNPRLQQAREQKAGAAMSIPNLQGGYVCQDQMRRTDLMPATAPNTPESQCKSATYHANRSEPAPATIPKLRSSDKVSNEFPEPSYLRAILAGRYSREHDGGSVISGKRSTRSLHAVEIPSMAQSEHCHVPQTSGQHSDTAVHRSPRLSQSLNSNPQSSKNKRGRRAAIQNSIRQGKERHVSMSDHNAVDIDPDYLGIEHDFNAEDVARFLRPSNARGANWVRRLSKYRVSKRYSNPHQQEVSQISQGLYQGYSSNSLERENSTKSIGTNVEELASMYQECLDMPGSFEGSRWASRTSRMLWDLVTTDDR